MVIHCRTFICLLNWFLGGLRLFSDVWSENASLFKRFMKIHSNSPILHFGFKGSMTHLQVLQISPWNFFYGWLQTRPKIKFLFSGATFHISLTKSATLNRLLHCSLWRFSGGLFYLFSRALFYISGANLPVTPVYFPPCFWHTCTMWEEYCEHFNKTQSLSV